MATAEADIAVREIRTLGAVDRALRVLTSTPFLGVAVAALSWPIASIVPQTGPDPSWVAGLYMAHGQGLRFGTEFVFTYGPLGFLQEPVLYDTTMWVLAFLYRGFVHVALATSLIWVGRRAFPLAVALVVSYALLAIGYLESEVVLLALIWCVVGLGDRPPSFVAPMLALGGGAIAAIELLGKVNFGIAVLAFCAVSLLAMPGRRRNVPIFAVVFLLCLLSLWLLTGQGLSNAPEFASNTVRIVSGYSSAMPTNITYVGWERPFAVLAMGLLVFVAAAVAWRDPLPRRLAVPALVALFAFLEFKQGFVRQGLGNTPAFFTLMLGGAIAVAFRLPERLREIPVHAAAVALIAPFAAMALMAVPSPSLLRALEPDDHATFLRQDLDALLSQGERERLSSEGQRAMRSAYGLDRGTLRLIGGRTVHIEPWEIGVAWAYDLNWRPLPVIQGYSAYEPDLDKLNAEGLSGPDGPALILRQNTRAFSERTSESIDERNLAWDPPAATLAMLCHYRTIRATRRWQLLERTASRCGPQRPVGVVRTRTDRSIRVPAPRGSHDIVFACIAGVGVEGGERLRTILYRARQRTIAVDGNRSWRIVPGTAGDGLILRASAGADYAPPFQLAPDAHTFSLRIHGSEPRSIVVRFFSRSIEPLPRSIAAS